MHTQEKQGDLAKSALSSESESCSSFRSQFQSYLFDLGQVTITLLGLSFLICNGETNTYWAMRKMMKWDVFQCSVWNIRKHSINGVWYDSIIVPSLWIHLFPFLLHKKYNWSFDAFFFSCLHAQRKCVHVTGSTGFSYLFWAFLVPIFTFSLSVPCSLLPALDLLLCLYSFLLIYVLHFFSVLSVKLLTTETIVLC